LLAVCQSDGGIDEVQLVEVVRLAESDAVTLRSATPDDAEKIYAVHLSNGEVDEWRGVPECRDQVGWMGQFDAASVVAEVGGAIVGEMKVWWGEDVPDLGSTLDVSTLYVHRDCQHKGIGRRLLGWALASARQHSCERVTVWCNEDSELFYRKCGFKDGLLLQRFLASPSSIMDTEMSEVHLGEIDNPAGRPLLTHRILHPSQRWRDLLWQQANVPVLLAGEERRSVLSFSSKGGALAVFRLHHWENDLTKAELYLWCSGATDLALSSCLVQGARLGLQTLSILAYGEVAQIAAANGWEDVGESERVLALQVRAA
jgi:GNAT superfamily N-acetyltransferase